jgi:hypothetical protein
VKNVYLIPALFLALSSNTLNAEKPSIPASDPKITSIMTGRYWQNDGMEGIYRVVIWSEGFEHVSSGVAAEWIADPNDPNELPKIIHSALLVKPGTMFLEKPTLTRTKNGFSVQLSGTHAYESANKISCAFELLPNKTVKTVKPCN